MEIVQSYPIHLTDRRSIVLFEWITMEIYQCYCWLPYCKKWNPIKAMWDISDRDLAGYPFVEHYPVKTDLLSRHFLWKFWTSLTFPPAMYLFFIKKILTSPIFPPNKRAGFRN